MTNEELVGRAIRGRRDEYVIATKFAANRADDEPGDVSTSGRSTAGRVRAQRRSRARCSGSAIDHVDLYYQHRVDPNADRGDGRRDGRARCRQGKVRHLGLCEASPETIRRAHAVHPITALQTEYSLWTRDPEAEILPTCRELGIGFVAYSPLGRGFLAGRFTLAGRARRGRLPPHQPALHRARTSSATCELAAKVAEIAAEKGVTPGAARARVGARPGRRHRADPRHEAARATSRRTRAPPTSSSRRTIWRGSTRSCQRWPASATTRPEWPRSTSSRGRRLSARTGSARARACAACRAGSCARWPACAAGPRGPWRCRPSPRSGSGR